MEGNYYAKYFLEVSDWWGVGSGNFQETRGLTRDFAGGFWRVWIREVFAVGGRQA
jgi:hypothetical protein